MGMKKTLCRGVADAWGLVAAAAGGADGRAGVSDILGRLARPCARARGPAERRGEGWAGRLARAEQLAGRPTSSFPFLFFISFPLFEFKFGLKFEFQIGAAYSLEF